jgi:hypothetical protein
VAREQIVLTTILLGLGLVACGGNPTSTSQQSQQTDTAFDNHSSASTEQLKELWVGAQTQLATQAIPLNPVTASVKGTPVTYSPANSRAYTIEPDGLGVYGVPDLTVAQLQSENPGVPLQHGSDPTGIIHCPENANHVRYCVSYCEGGAVYAAASQVLNPSATGYEFQNVILMRLGYDVAGR